MFNSHGAPETVVNAAKRIARKSPILNTAIEKARALALELPSSNPAHGIYMSASTLLTRWLADNYAHAAYVSAVHDMFGTDY